MDEVALDPVGLKRQLRLDAPYEGASKRVNHVLRNIRRDSAVRREIDSVCPEGAVLVG